MEDLKTFEDACKKTGIEIKPIKHLRLKSFVNKWLGFKFKLEQFTPVQKVSIITRALNGGWTPGWNTLSNPLMFKSEEACEHFHKNFKQELEDYFSSKRFC